MNTSSRVVHAVQSIDPVCFIISERTEKEKNVTIELKMNREKTRICIEMMKKTKKKMSAMRLDKIESRSILAAAVVL